MAVLYETEMISAATGLIFTSEMVESHFDFQGIEPRHARSRLVTAGIILVSTVCPASPGFVPGRAAQ